jgi:hypothetical protein
MKRLTATLALWAGITAVAQAAEPITLGLNYPRTGPYKKKVWPRCAVPCWP